jgi:hypothetical protein
MMNQFEVDVSDDALRQVSELANEQVKLEDKISTAEAELKTLKQSHNKVSQVDIPEALAECGLSEFKLANGMKVTVNPFYSASIPKDRQDEALTWLRDNDHGDLIKQTISVDFGRGEDDAAGALKEVLADSGASYTDRTGVHSSTLRAFVREQVESGQNLPLDLLGVFIGQKTIIKEG